MERQAETRFTRWGTAREEKEETKERMGGEVVVDGGLRWVQRSKRRGSTFHLETWPQSSTQGPMRQRQITVSWSQNCPRFAQRGSSSCTASISGAQHALRRCKLWECDSG